MWKSYRKRLGFIIIIITLIPSVFASDGWSAAPSAPTMTVETSGLYVRVSWNSVEGATGYTLFYCHYPECPTLESFDAGSRTSVTGTLSLGHYALYLAVKAYNDTESSSYSNVVRTFDPYAVDGAEMLERYKASRQYYDEHQAELDAQAAAHVRLASIVFDDHALHATALWFLGHGWFTASSALDHFLDGTGTNYRIDIVGVVANGGVSHLVYGDILNQLDSGQNSGQIQIEQGDWGANRAGQDAKFAFGTFRLNWESDGTNIVISTGHDNIYSFNINANYSSRPTIPLYKLAGDLILSPSGLSLSGQASDFYFTGRTSIGINTLRSNYSPPSAPTLNSSVSGNAVTLSWNAVTGASGYKLYIGTSLGNYDGGIMNLDNITSQTYDVPSGTYYLVLQAYNNSGGRSRYSNEVIVNVPSAPSGGSTVTDIDGNVYNTVIIGTQEWMKENLKVTKYRNGDAIGTTTSTTIYNETSPKYQWAYNDDEGNVATYGRLYTWHAATDSRGLCPTGWHVSTDSEWTALTDYLGGSSVAGGKMKEAGTTHWNSPNTGADNSSGFTALPGGGRNHDGSSIYIGYAGYWWSATEYYTTSASAWNRLLSYYYDGAYRFNHSDKDHGFSVRCVRD